MKAYTGIISKEEFVNELKKHQAADNFIKVEYWDDEEGKGCAVGCSLESISRLKNINIDFSDRKRYEDLLGIPEWLARLEDKIFESLPCKRYKSWPVEFGEAINEGADLEQIKGPFLIFLLNFTLTNVDNEKFPEVTKIINKVIELWKNNEFEAAKTVAKEAKVAGLAEWEERAVVAAARAAAAAAEPEAWVVAWVARWAATEAKKETWEYFADELLKMIKNTKPQE